MINEAKDTLRKEKSRGLFKRQEELDQDKESESILELVPSHAKSPKEELEIKETKARLEEVIQRLPEKERQVFILRYLNDLSLAEIAQSLNLAVGTVKAHLSHGVEKVKATFERKSNFPSSSIYLAQAEGR